MTNNIMSIEHLTAQVELLRGKIDKQFAQNEILKKEVDAHIDANSFALTILALSVGQRNLRIFRDNLKQVKPAFDDDIQNEAGDLAMKRIISYLDDRIKQFEQQTETSNV